MDPMESKELQEVRNIIEQSTAKVSLRDLEKKGFRKVKVLRSNDIDELIRKAVHLVVAREGAGQDREAIVEKSREELNRLMAAAQAAEQERGMLAEENAALQRQLRELKAWQAQRQDLEGKLKELQRRLADEEEARRRAESQLSTQGLAATSRAEEAERRAQEVERRLAEQTAKLQERDRELDSLKRRNEEAEARALALSSRAAAAEEASAKLTQLREEADQLRAKLRQAETERRLVEELEVPKLRERVSELEGELKAAKAQIGAGFALTDDRIRNMFRELLAEVQVGARGPSEVSLQKEFDKLQRTIAETVARASGRGERVTEADLDAAKVSIAAMFAEDAKAVISNIERVEVKEKQAAGVKDHLKKLKALRKGGGSE